MKRIKTKVLVLSLLIGAMNPIACYAANYQGGLTELMSALGAAGTNSFIATGDISLSSANLGTMTGTTLTLDGTNLSLSGASTYSGITVATGKTLNINNYGSFSGSTITKAIENFKSTTSGGFLNNVGTLTINNSAFRNNIVTGNSGGAIYSNATTTASITKSIFTGNIATYGGAIAIAGGNVNLTNVDFYNNAASETGGAIYNSGNTNTITIVGGTYTGNAANNNWGGGAISNWANGTINISNATFGTSTVGSGNTAVFCGGAIYNNNNGLVTITGSSFTNNKVTNGTYGGGAIFNNWAGTLTASNSTFTGNSATGPGGAAYNWYSGVLNLLGDTFTGNNSPYGGVVYNFGSGTINIANSTLGNSTTGNTSAYGGAVFNNDAGIINISGSSFTNNSASQRGGAIASGNAGGRINVTNSTFKDNTATVSGGAIYNTAYLNLIADKGVTSFTGNKAAGISNAIYMSGVNTNLNTGNGGYILFNDKISALSSASTIYVNRTGNGLVATGYLSATAPTTGNVILNEQITNASTFLNGGMLTLGQYKNNKLTATDGVTPATSYFNNAALTLNGGILNTANSNADTNLLTSLTSSASSGLFFDANLSNGSSDSFTATSASGTLTLKGVNISADGTSGITLFNGAGTPTLDASGLEAYTNLNKYTFTPSGGTLSVTQNGALGGLGNAVSSATTYRSFSGTADYNLTGNLGAMGGASGSILTIFGNQKNINGSNYSGLSAASGLTLNVYDIGKYDTTNGITASLYGLNLATGSGAFINNSGTTYINNSVFYNNRNPYTTGTGVGGGVAYNASGANLYVTNSVFSSNYTKENGGAIVTYGNTTIMDSIFNQNTTDLVGGALSIRTGSVTNILNTKFTGNSINVGSSYGGGAIWAYQGTTNITNSDFDSNIARGYGGVIANYISTLAIADSRFTNNQATSYGGAIWNNSSTFQISNSTFTSNLSGVSGGAIYHSGNGLITLTGNIFGGSTQALGNKAPDGGAVYNASIGNINIIGGSFTNNKATAGSGGAFYNNSTGTITITEGTSFEKNIATASGGAIYNKSGTLSITKGAFGNSTAGTGNSALNGGAIYNDTGATSTIIDSNFTNNIATTSGGAIYNAGTLNIRVNPVVTTTFSGNTANSISNAIHLATNATLNLNAGTSGNITFEDAITATSNSTNTININSSAIDATRTTGNINFNSSVSNSTLNLSGGKTIFKSNMTNDIINVSNIDTTFGSATASNVDYSNTKINVTGATQALSKITFKDNSAVNLNSTSTTTINNSAFTSNNTTNGAVYNNGGTVTITDTSFTNNAATTLGGAIYNSGNLYIKNSAGATTSFTGNTLNSVANDISLSGGTTYLNAGTGGTIAFNSGISSSAIANAININSTSGDASLTTGTINLYCPISTATLNVYGGTANFGVSSTPNVNFDNVAFNLTGGTQTFTKSTLLNGSRITISGASTSTTANNSTFNGASYTGSGGAINISSGTLNLNTDNFNNYSANTGNGGAIYNNGGTVTDTGSTYTSNSGNNGGGAICNTSIMNITSGTFVKNHDVSGGGAIYNNGGTVIINSSTFGSANVNDANYSPNGGAIFNKGSSTISNSTFSNNSATTNGGAIYNASGYTATIADSIFNTNTATTSGGAIYNAGTLNIQATNNNTTSFTGNTANGNSNALYLAGGTVNLNAGTNGTITFNDAIASSVNTNVININQGGTLNSGTINFNNDVSTAKFNIANGTTNFNSELISSIVNITGGTTNFNSDLSSDVINVSGGNTTFGNTTTTSTYNDVEINISGGTQTFNKLSFTNGTVINLNSSTSAAVTNNSTFDSNTSTNGGAIYNSIGGTSSSSNSTFSNNIATGDGGAIYNTQGTTTDSGSMFDSNRAVNGGAVYNSATGQFTGSTFKSNIATTSGGAIYNATGATTTIADSTFNTNSATTSGGAIYNAGNINIQANNNKTTSFTGNTAGGSSNALYLAGGTVNLSTGTNGIITFNDAIESSLNTNVININQGASLNSGTVNFNNQLSPVTMNIYNGTTNINTGMSSSTLNISGGTSNFADNKTYNNVAFNLTGGTQNFNLETFTNGSRFVLNNASTIANIDNSTFNGGSFTGSGGAINISSGTLNLDPNTFSNYVTTGNGGVIANAGTLNDEDSTFTSNIASGNGGAIYNTGTTTLTNTRLTNNSANTFGGAIYSNGGSVTLIANGQDVTLSNNTDSSGSNAIYLASGATLNLNVSGANNLIFNDKVNSDSTGNNININSSAVVGAPTTGTVKLNNTISNSTVNLYNGTLYVNNDSYLNGNNMLFSGGTLNMINNAVGTMALGNVNFANGTTTNLRLDADLANSQIDKITATSVGAGTGTLNINNIHMISDASAKNTALEVASNTIKDHINLGVTTVDGPIYKYDLAYSSTTGQMSFTSSKAENNNFSPAVLSSPVSSLVGAFMNQTNIYSEALGRAEVFMTLPQMDRVLMRYNNKFAAVGGSDVQPEVFSPTFLPEERGGSWFKQYMTIENIPLRNGPNVSNVGYGVLIGNDTPMYHLKHGYDGYLTAFVGYNGSHQNYDTVGVYQNGAALGLTGTVYKGNFFAALTASIADSAGSASTQYGQDNFNTIIAGAAMKTGYNIEIMRGKLIIQPSYAMSYTFANTFDYVNAAGVSITSQPLNAIQIAPGIKVIANCKNGWQPYIGANMVWNIMDAQKFYANDAQLPQMSVAPYAEYGIGLQRRWGERFSGFGQAMFRGGGRNGVAFQFGFRWAI